LTKRWIAALIALVGLAALGITIAQISSNQQARAAQELQTEALQSGDLRVIAEADGVVRADQSASLTWQTTGSVGAIHAVLGQQVVAGQVLAELDPTTLPQPVILAQADLIAARRELDDLLNSQVQSAQAQQAVEQAEQALEDARNPAVAQARALEAVASAQKGVDEAQRTLAVLQTPVSKAALTQARASMLLAENVLNRTQDTVARIERRLAKPERQYFFFESRVLYRKFLKNLQIKLASDQRAYEDTARRYNDLLKPVDPQDLALAQANVAGNLAQQAQAQRELQRIQDGTSAADLAVLEAQLADARRNRERLQAGPDPQEILAAQARVDAAQAVLNQARITAPFDGVITHVPILPGDLVTPGAQAFRLDSLANLLVDVQVSEIDINRVSLGQPALVACDAVNDRQYQAQVVQVASVGTQAAGTVSFKVQIKLLDADARVKPGMTAAVTIVLGELSQVLQVPNRAVRLLEGQRVVYIQRGDQVTPVPVTLGLSSAAYSQVLQGDLKPGDLVVLNPPSD